MMMMTMMMVCVCDYGVRYLMQTNYNVKKRLVISFKKSHLLQRSLRGM